MYLGHRFRTLRYDTVVAFLLGLDAGSDHSALDGFREICILQLDDGDNLDWPTLVLKLCLPPNVVPPLTEDQDAAAVGFLLDLLDEFFAEIAADPPRSRARLHREYQLWLRQQTWFNLDVVRFGTSKPAPLVTVDEAAARLGVARTEICDQIHRGALKTHRAGAQLLIWEADIAGPAQPGSL